MYELDSLYRVALENAAPTKAYKKRYAYDKIDKLAGELQAGQKKPAILLSGMRGVGKTTLLLQLFSNLENSFYFSADSPYAKSKSTYSLLESLHREGYKNIFIDEVHKNPKWADELKSAYDDFNMQIVASGSSVAAIKKGCILLGRRALDFYLPPLSLGEFFHLNEEKEYGASLQEALDKKATIQWLAMHPQAEKHYRNYLSFGGFPFTAGKGGQIYSLVKRMIYEDAISEFSLTEKKADLCEKLLSFISLSPPGEFSYTSFSASSGYAKSSVYDAVSMLCELGILRKIEEASPKARARERVKLIFSHPNLRSAFCGQLMREPEIGALREEYFAFHMGELGFGVFMPKGMRKNPDYEIILKGEKALFEIGGPSKTKSQLLGMGGSVLSDENLTVLGFVKAKTNQP